VTLTADTFDATVRRGDWFRITSGPFTGTQIQILSVDSTTQVTLVADAPAFAGTSWTVRRQDWYRSRFPSNAVMNTKVAHQAAEELTMGARTGFLNGVGPPQFITGEYYTFGASIGILKDATQQLTFSYDMYNEKTELVHSATNITASDGTTLGGYVPPANQVSVIDDDPFTGAGRPGAAAQLQLGHYQRRLNLNGTNGTQNTTISGSATGVVGLQYAIDLASDVNASMLRFGLNSAGWSPATARELTIDLYSSTAAQFAGPSPKWTLEATYASSLDCPQWNIAVDTFHDATTSAAIDGTASLDIEIDLVALGLSATAKRYWKIHIHSEGSSVAIGTVLNNVVAFDTTAGPAGPLPIVGPAAKYLPMSVDSNYLANYPVRVVFVQDEGTGTTSSRSTTNFRVVTLSGDTFGTVVPFDVAANDYFRVTRLSAGGATKSISAPNILTGVSTITDTAGGFGDVFAGGRIRITGATNAVNIGTFSVVEVIDSQNITVFNPAAIAEGPNSLSWQIWSPDFKILTRDSTTQITLTVDVPYWANEDWEVVRNADVRPRDDEGGVEDQARFPLTAGEIFLCPVTGHIFYHSSDVSNARTVRFERVVKVKRSL
jgi:hypothetical protein